jgi:hypothetical protein
VSPFAATGTQNFTLRFSNGTTENIATNIGASAVNELGNTIQTKSVTAEQPNAVFELTMTANQANRFDIRPAPDSALQPRIDVFTNASAAPIKTIANGQFNYVNGATETTYRFVVSHNNVLAANTPHNFSISTSKATAEIEPNNDRATATPIVFNGPVVGTIANSEVDVFAFDLADDSIIQLHTVSVDNIDTQIYVCKNDDGTCSTNESRVNNLGFDDNSGAGLNASLMVQLPAGSYIASVTSATVSAGLYDLLLSRPATVSEVEPNDASTPTSLKVGEVGVGEISTGDTSVDVWKVDITDPRAYFIHTRPLLVTNTDLGNLDTQVWICAQPPADNCTYENTNALSRNDDDGVYYYSAFTTPTMTRGTWYIVVHRYIPSSSARPPSTGNYLLSIGVS